MHMANSERDNGGQWIVGVGRDCDGRGVWRKNYAGGARLSAASSAMGRQSGRFMEGMNVSSCGNCRQSN